jgi:hypothetical protein
MEGETHPHAHGHLEEAKAVPRDLLFLRSGDLDTLHRAGRLFAGQIASRPPSASRLRCFDLLLTSFPHFVERFRRDGVDAEYSLNRHIEAAEGFANNMRLFEATGVGAMLVTDDGKSLSELFRPAASTPTRVGPGVCRAP